MVFNVCEGAQLIERGNLPPSSGVVVDGARREDVGFGGGQTPGGVSRRLWKWSAFCYSLVGDSAGSNQINTLTS